MTLGTRIVVMNDGLIQQVDTPVNLYNKPQSLFVASFIGSPQMNIVEATVQKKGDGAVLLFGEFTIKLTDAKARAVLDGGYDGKTVMMGIRPEDLHDEEMFISAHPDGIIEADVEVTELLGAEVYLYLLCAGQPMIARVSPRSVAKAGDKIQIAVNINKVHIFDKDTEHVITN
jgi:multiple sugar transport system ATP-binding protein